MLLPGSSTLHTKQWLVFEKSYNRDRIFFATFAKFRFQVRNNAVMLPKFCERVFFRFSRCLASVHPNLNQKESQLTEKEVFEHNYMLAKTHYHNYGTLKLKRHQN
eukprot:TRINITY_DN6446_c0_g1_i1.p1 TRINITY_DN6446_c0_g1~~TRINITY_DN6446_c0_g1_i1.p1  ORF type:complete len:105 (-),score=0.83 TRINITY_DN6446_c0_g1_i1:132-446(-)